MSFLTPLYVLGALTIAAPLIFHLIRRTTRGETAFSSLMFLEPSPPRLTRRSRLENWPLLLLRAAALALLAAAFARPFLRESAALNIDQAEGSRIALLIDTSASMRRGDLWDRAKAKALEVIASARPDDQLAVFAFDATTRPLLGFDESATLDPTRRRAQATALVEGLSPTWDATHLGQALIDAVGAIENVGDAAREASNAPRRIVLVGDLQQGGRLDVLGDFEWPADVELDVRSVADDGSNAALEALASVESAPDAKRDDATDALRVRVSNDPTSKRESFILNWDEAARAPAIPVYVPPGESRVVRAPRPSTGSRGRSLRLEGDDRDFDNTLYLATAPDESATVLFVGGDPPDDPNGLLYYLVRAFEASPRRAVKVEPRSPNDPIVIDADRPAALIVVAAETSPSNIAVLTKLADQGGTVLVIISAPGKTATLSALAGAPELEVQDATVRGDVMLGVIDFEHPLFAPFAGPQFNDFTKIRFWKYRKLTSEALVSARVVARFETGDPAVIEKPIGKGRLVIFTSGWGPSDGQLARSSKFVPLMWALLDGLRTTPEGPTNSLVREPLTLPEGATAVRKPDGAKVELAEGATAFHETDAPGIYTIEGKQGPRSIALNLDPMESQTAPLNVETLEQFGCKLAKPGRIAADHESARQLRNAELEGRQKLWRPVVLSALAVLIVETWLAGRLGRSRPALEGATTS
jgi:hypothetical protein